MNIRRKGTASSDAQTKRLHAAKKKRLRKCRAQKDTVSEVDTLLALAHEQLKAGD